MTTTAPTMADGLIAELQERVRAATAAATPLVIHGSGSKAFCRPTVTGEPLDVSGLTGIVDYEPTELVVTVRAGTPLAELQAALAAEGQMLAFEPPAFAATATLGGTVACGLSGPRRPYAGALRDFVLGVRCLNGHGEDLRFGGQVMKNVAGYDIARLQAGAYGRLGVLLEISFKVLPLPEAETTVALELSPAAAIERMNRLAGRPLPLSAAAHIDGGLYLRFSGSAAAVAAACADCGGAVLTDAAAFWTAVREQQHDFFQTGRPLWRLSLPATAAMPAIDGADAADWLIDWGGAQRWLRAEAPATAVHAAAQAAGGWARGWRGVADDRRWPVQPAALQQLQHRLKAAFDPAAVFNHEADAAGGT
ncbi:glycolate oxidase FAD binding subunit [Methylohalomonas lacus]|uniref:Glycolate oxidase FAD binding subunit n=1 Tax=Methylohalomonas lacus TaxID=398773 RepID=A0AAE3HJR5_9GAMM|nr:glycolate oxidase subunit GlcE [Methylohalomonas lacus]MCS3902324.1 glycolate oxidase FAD binding subunit [Methylohalomonas lacus]